MRSLVYSSAGVALLFAAALTSANAPAAQARTITHEDVWLMPRVSAPAISADGRHAVVNVVEPAYDADSQVSDLWLVSTDGSGEPRRITASKAAEATPVFSPDGSKLAFSAKREGDDAAQIYVLDLKQGGDAVRATSISTGARMPKFSPDGRSLLFVSDLHPEARDDADSQRLSKALKERKFNARVYTGFPIRNWDRWNEPTQPRVFVQTIGELTAKDLLLDTELLKHPGYGGRVAQGVEELDAVWAPDGRSVVIVASRNRNQSAYAYTHADLWQLPIDGGTPRRLTGEDALSASDSYESPRFSNDGKTLFALVTPRTDRVFNGSRLASFSWPAAEPIGRIAVDAGSVGSYAIRADGREVYLTAENAGKEELYRASRSAGNATRAVELTRGVYSQLVVGGRGADEVILAMYESATEPPELVRIDAKRGSHRRLTEFAVQRAAALDLPPLESFWIEHAGRRVHSLLAKPPGFDPARKYPLFVLIHGGPHTMWRDMWVIRWHYHLLAAPGYVVLLTNYSGSTGYGEPFAQAIQGDPLRGPADEINAAADAAIARYGFIDGERQCAGGASYGGHLANWLQATTTRYRCLVSHAGLVSLASQWGTSDIAFSREANLGGPHWQGGAVWREQDPIRYADQFKTPTLVTFGERDFRVPINNGLEYWAALQRQQVESRLVVFPDENHWILKGENSRYFYQEVQDWLARWLASDQ